MKSNFEERRENRIKRYKELAEKFSHQSDQEHETARKMASCIPMGQPILIGHHSEKADRRFRERIHKKIGKAIEAAEKADYYREKAITVESNGAIFSDDPKAITLLKERIKELQVNHEIMKEVNKRFKKEGIKALENVDPVMKKAAESYLKYSSYYNKPFPPFSLANSSAEIRRLKKRLERLEAMANDETVEIKKNDVLIKDNVEDNRVQIFFSGIPDEKVRQFLKSHGFRWARSLGCWQRYRSNAAMYYAKMILDMEG